MIQVVSHISHSAKLPIPHISILSTTPEHLRALAMVLRPEDEGEILAFGISPAKALWRSYKGSIFSKTAFIGSDIAACWGCSGSFLGTTGQPWLLTSEAVRNISPLRFARIYQQEVHQMLEFFQILENYVGAEYDAAIRLLDIVGFTVGEPERKGNGMYRRFGMEK